MKTEGKERRKRPRDKGPKAGRKRNSCEKRDSVWPRIFHPPLFRIYKRRKRWLFLSLSSMRKKMFLWTKIILLSTNIYIIHAASTAKCLICFFYCTQHIKFSRKNHWYTPLFWWYSDSSSMNDNLLKIYS